MRYHRQIAQTGRNKLPDKEHGLLRTLVHATYWLDDGLQAHMKKHTGLSLPRAQSMAMIYLTEGVDRPSDLAQKLQVSKQAAQQMIKGLQAKGIVVLRPDPNNGRQKFVEFTDTGRELGRVAREGLYALEKELAQRIGPQNVSNLRAALSAEWGEPPG